MMEDKAKILVVDDVWQNLELMEAMLSLAGYEVLLASQVNKPLTRFRRTPLPLSFSML
jgi:CheY-like chemotaxis protein